MARRNKNRAAAAARGTSKDPEAFKNTEAGAAALAERDEKRAARKRQRPDSALERRTARVFTIIEVILVIVPVTLVCYLWMTGGSLGGLRDAFEADPAITVSFITAMCQPLVAWLLRFVHQHYREGDGGYAVANLIGLICGELLLQNAVGVLGCGFLLWRIWRRVVPNGEFAAWRRDRTLGGKLADLSGVIVIILLGAICAFATWRLSTIAA